MYFGLWILVFLGALVVELATATSLVSIWFCVGSVVCPGRAGVESGLYLAGRHLLCGVVSLSGSYLADGFPVFTRQYCRDERRPGDRPTCPASERHYRGSLGELRR